jgi:hypothetical protein
MNVTHLALVVEPIFPVIEVSLPFQRLTPIQQPGVLQRSVAGVRVGLHPSKGGKWGWDNPVWGQVILHAPLALEEAHSV